MIKDMVASELLWISIMERRLDKALQVKNTFQVILTHT